MAQRLGQQNNGWTENIISRVVVTAEIFRCGQEQDERAE